MPMNTKEDVGKILTEAIRLAKLACKDEPNDQVLFHKVAVATISASFQGHSGSLNRILLE